MNDIAKQIAESLLQIKAINLNPANPFVWASGWHSPIYCDNRKVLSFPQARKQVYTAMAELIKEKYADVDIIAGVATGAIAMGMLVAELLGKPFIYIRSSAKSHGMANQIEGEYKNGAKVVVIEDLISTGGSSLSAVEALREAKVEVLGMVAIFTYGFKIAEDNFANAGVTLDTLSNYNTLIELAAASGSVTPEQLETLHQWRENPSVWGK
ncbi:MAG: orotate phosphoribosyltransferase [Rikenellaceae bacterium]